MTFLNPLEISDWDTQVSALPGATIFHRSGWARVMIETYAYQPVYFTHQVGGRLDSVLPLMEVDSWLTGRRGIALPFTDQAPLLSSDQQAAASLIAAAQGYAKERNYKYLEFRGGFATHPRAPASVTFYNHYLELHSNEDGLLKTFGKSTRGAIKKAEQTGLKVEFSQSLEAMESFYRLLNLTRRKHGVPPQPFSFFINLQKHLLAPGHGWIVLARLNGTPIAGAVCLHAGSGVTYKYGASDEAHQQLRASNLVIWEAIRRYAREGFTRFDFGRTSLGNDGLRRFKLSWGTVEQSLDYVRLNVGNGDTIPVKDAASGWHNHVFRVLPPAISRVIGAALYRHIP